MSESPSTTLPPAHTQVLVIGGGPAGSYAASALAREGIQVTLFEASKFPRYHVGESLIPSIRHYLRFIGAEEKLAACGFVRKPGSAIKFNQFKREGYTDFVALGHNNNAWNVVRSEFDQMLMNHARSSGASVYELTKVNSIAFSESDPRKPISVSWTHTPPPLPLSPPASPTIATDLSANQFLFAQQHPPKGPVAPSAVTGTTSFSYVIDATGRNGIMSTKYLKNRHFNTSLKNVAVWGYWTDVGIYGVGTKRQGAPWFEALTDESGWAWFIPLHNGTTSIGVVMNQNTYNEKLKKPLTPTPFSPDATPNPKGSTMTSHYISNLSLAPGLVKLVTNNGKMQPESVHSASDFSYSAASYSGHGYRIIGDAGAFIDPFFSSGVHLALTSALSAASTICASIRGNCSEGTAAEWHTKRVATSYTRFQVVVLSAYKQIRSQTTDVLSDIDEDNYDRAFTFLRPVIQGASDMGTLLDFCVNLFNPTSPEQHEHLSTLGGFKKELLDVTAPVMDPALFEKTIRPPATPIHNLKLKHDSQSQSSHEIPGNLQPGAGTVEEAQMILNKINARRVVHSEYTINNLELESINGYVVRLQRGTLGLKAVSKPE
ncbi:hypothetical protein BD779DRAFT_1610472 [Infundibulicybe gibba]|nr:hypothetical protein BD779DRAFT_1610472 [Infundibulicybe gibba]